MALPDWKALDPADRDAMLITLCGQGLSASRIAERFLNCTRSAVVGRVHRLQKRQVRVALRGRPSTNRTRQKPAKGAGKASRRVIAGVEHVVARNLQAELPVVVVRFPTRESYFEPLPETQPVHLDDMSGGRCNWPVSGLFGREPIYCGAPAEGTYCATHHRIAYQPNSSLREKRHVARA